MGQHELGPGDVVRVGPAYSMDTRSRSLVDEYTGTVATVVCLGRNGDVGLARGVVRCGGAWWPEYADVFVNPGRLARLSD